MSAAGTWINEYGSIMTLVDEGNILRGVYRSSTGSVGTYEVLGVQIADAATDTRGQALALAISWRSKDDALPDPSWHWTSGLCGQISYQKGQEVLVLAHVLVASSEFPGLAGAGSYIDKLTYRRLANQGVEPSRHYQNDVPANSLTGDWLAKNGTRLTLGVSAGHCQKLGIVSGTIALQSESFEVRGFTDLRADAVDQPLQSVALVAAIGTSEVLSLSGMFDTSSGQMTLLEMTGVSTAPGTSYCQTRMTSTSYRHNSRH